ncbi:hypothetical protein N8I77_001449 [Diaporthe amygdali]|uniref:DUF7907 domain-containing protein n=1 Tax=Phomopsis amygdali TaxID=1214568 RepID=A0AAD9W858_PHOAM|nr:hypothetical protein N8I77_001449 [Diaporthe amygdali]
MVMQTLLKATILAAAATAASIPVRSTSIPDAFRLSATVTGLDLNPSLQGQELTYVSNADCQANIVFAPAGEGATFYTTGEIVGVNHFSDDSSPGAGMIVTPGGTATVPSSNVVELQCSASTTGVSVTSDGLQYLGGAWMACPRDGAVVLSFKQAGQRTLASCADVQLLPIY